MKRILLDENIDSFLKPLFADKFEVMTVRECLWNGKKNGELLRLAQQEFDVLVTMDKNLEHHQNLSVFNLGVVVLQTGSNAYRQVAPLMPRVNEVLTTTQCRHVEFSIPMMRNLPTKAVSYITGVRAPSYPLLRNPSGQISAPA